ncbi:MAG: type I methionyl aminopeptidase [Candidatus Omnitrophota bacterium]
MTNLLTADEMDSLRKAGSIVRECLETVAGDVKEGVSTKELEELADRFIKSKNARAAFLGYKGYPASICTSRNDKVVHGIPSKSEILAEGDIVSVDIGVYYNGLYADAAKTFEVGDVSEEARRLVTVTEEALSKGIEKARSGNHVEDISWAIQSFVEAHKYSVVRVFVGHGIGRSIHEEPEVPNFGRPGNGRLLKDGMVLAIEPMVNAGTGDIEILEDKWTAVTKDRELSAHFEHTVIISRNGPEVVT